MTQRSLATSAVECARLFNNLSSQLLDREWETRTTLSQPSIEDESGRYKIWAGNLGAFQRLPAKSSLDYRLRESPKVATQIQELLEDLRHSLQKISAIASGESPNRVADSTDSEDDHDEDEPEKDSDGSEDEDFMTEADADERPHQLSEAGELFRSVKDTITGLFRISIIIRKASPRDRFARALAARQEPFDDRFDIDHVSHKFPMLNIKEKEWFKERLGKAITQRRQYLRYARDHRDKLATDPKDLWQPEDVGPRTTLLPVLSQAGKTNLTKPTNTLAPTTASTLLAERLAIKEEDLHDNQSRTSYAVSFGEDDDSHLRLPSLAEVSKDGNAFECPLCWTVQDMQSDSTWRKHVFGDLRPYICTFEDCDIKLFSNRREWFEHELSHHRAKWCCDFCGKDEFRSLNSFKDHVRSRHMQGLKNDQLDALSEASRRSIDRIPASDCAFCQEWEAKLRLANPNISDDEIVVVTPFQFRHHVGAHMQQLALFSIPRGFLEDDAATKSVTSLGNPQSNIAGLRKAQITLEFGSPEDALKELQKLHDQTPNDLEVHSLLSKCYQEIRNESAALVHSGRAQDLPAQSTVKPQYIFRIDEIKETDDGEIKTNTRSSWVPPVDIRGHARVGGGASGRWWFCDGHSIHSIQNPPPNSVHYQTTTMYFNASFGFWVSRGDATHDKPDWQPLSFNQSTTDFSSYVTNAGQEQRLACIREDQTWPQMLLPDVYHGPQTPYMQYGGLTGDISILWALIAFSMPDSYLPQMIPQIFQQGVFQTHTSRPIRQHQRGVIVWIYTCADSSDETANTTKLQKYEGGHYGKYYN